MNSIMRMDQRLASLPLTKPLKVASQAVPIEDGDLVLVCIGFETRSLEVLRRCNAANLDDITVLGISYAPSIQDNRNDEFQALIVKQNWRVEHHTHDRENPSGSAIELTDKIDSLGRRKVWIDLSSMSRLLILQLMSAFAELPKGFDNIAALYTAPELHYPTSEEFEREFKENKFDASRAILFLSSGVQEVTIVPELSSFAMQGQPVRLMTFPSFNPHQFTSVLTTVQPTNVDLVYGSASLECERWRKEGVKRINRVDHHERYSEVTTDTLDYRETYELLLKWYDAHGAREKLVICPTGSKLQSLAVGLVRAFLHDIQIVYPTPQKFAAPKKYTKGVSDLYSIDLNVFPSRASLSGFSADYSGDP